MNYLESKILIQTKGKYLIAGLAGIAFVAIFAVLLMPKASIGFVYKNKLPVANSSAFSAAGPIYLNNSLRETIEVKQPINVSEVQVLLATYARSNQGNMTISLIKMGRAVATKDIDLASLSDNSYISWKFKSQEFEAGEEFEILIESNAKDSNNGIAVYVTKNRSPQTLNLTLSGAQIEGSVIMNLMGEL